MGVLYTRNTEQHVNIIITFITKALENDKKFKEKHPGYKKQKPSYCKTEIKNTMMYYEIPELQLICDILRIQYLPKDKIGALKDGIATFYVREANKIISR